MTGSDSTIPTISSSLDTSHDNAAFDKSSDDQQNDSFDILTDSASTKSSNSFKSPSSHYSAETVQLKNRNYNGHDRNGKNMTCSSCSSKSNSSSSSSNSSISSVDRKQRDKSNELGQMGQKRVKNVIINLPESFKKENETADQSKGGKEKEEKMKEPVKHVQLPEKKLEKNLQKKTRFDVIKEKLTINKKYRAISFYRNNIAYFATILIWILLQIFFILLQLLVLHPRKNAFLSISRAAGILINFNACLIYLLVLRRLATFLRNSVIGRKFLVLDESLAFHKFLGFWIFFLAFIHTLFHCVNLCKYIFVD